MWVFVPHVDVPLLRVSGSGSEAVPEAAREQAVAGGEAWEAAD